jgi:hypothetical protein
MRASQSAPVKDAPDAGRRRRVYRVDGADSRAAWGLASTRSVQYAGARVVVREAGQPPRRLFRVVPAEGLPDIALAFMGKV